MPPDDGLEEWIPGAVLAGKYRIERALAVGAPGSAYIATQLMLDRSVAVHLVPASVTPAAERSDRDAIVLGRLKHPNVAEVYDSGSSEDGGLFLVTEYVAGQCLSEFLGGSALDIPSLLRVAQQICRGVRKAHAQGIVHRNLTPASVVVSDGGVTEGPHATVVDFALGLVLDEGVVRPPNECPLGGPLPTYRAPEQLRGEAVDTRTDVYALGLVMYEMLTGAPPFTSRSRAALREMHLEGSPPPVSVAPATGLSELEVIIRRCLAKRPDARYPDAGALLADLEAVAMLRELVEGQRAVRDAVVAPPVRSSPAPFRRGLLDARGTGRILALPLSPWPTFVVVAGGLVAFAALGWWFLSR